MKVTVSKFYIGGVGVSNIILIIFGVILCKYLKISVIR